ncbi:MAG TPA: thiamine-phosphate kinase [Thermoanaerobaculia bacterium]|jgi:thiamine-monophosphate kinase|nr:thiamine-phosphate kinase [Thermoanaerobaculia bacterium]
MNEAQLVARVRELFSPRIGDDAAVIDNQVYTTDLLIEDVDFTRAMSLRLIARKSLAVNLSDLAAMGAAPAYALLSLGLPEWARENADEMLVAYAEASQQYGIEIIGGDFSRAEKLTISVTAIGRIVTRPLLRTGARPGDRVYVSRPIGGSAAGFALMDKDPKAYVHREFVESAIRRHVDPEPELALGVALARIDEVTSCIDVSDGLSSDLHHLCDASNVGAEIEKERIPVFPDLLSFGARFGINVKDAVLHGGEEYALLFTSSLREADLSTRLGRPVYMIGRITKARDVILKEDGVPRPLEARGWDHFA